MTDSPAFPGLHNDFLLTASDDIYHHYSIIQTHWAGLYMIQPDRHDELNRMANQNGSYIEGWLGDLTAEITESLRNAGHKNLAVARNNYNLAELTDRDGQRLMRMKAQMIEASFTIDDAGANELINSLVGVKRLYEQRGFWRTVAFDCATYHPMIIGPQSDQAKRWIRQEYLSDQIPNDSCHCYHEVGTVVMPARLPNGDDSIENRDVAPIDPSKKTGITACAPN
jgi:hypothetical protein